MVATTAAPGELSSAGDLCEGRPLAVGSGLTSAERPPCALSLGCLLVHKGSSSQLGVCGAGSLLEWWVLPFLGCFTLVPASRPWPQTALPLFSQHSPGRLSASSEYLVAQSF